MANTDIVRFGVIGSGGIARRFAEGLKDVPNAQLAAVWNHTPEKAQQFAQDFGTTAVASLEALLASEIDAVYIGTPHTSHAQYSIAALQAGKAVLSEKPAATSLGELEAVLAHAAVHRKLFMEAMKPPFYPLFTKLREALAADPIGDIQFVRAGFASPDVPVEHNLYRADMAGGGLLDIGIYGAYLAVSFLGDATNVQTQGKVVRGVDTFAAVNSQHAKGWSQIYCGLGIDGAGDAMLAAPGGHVVIHEKWWSPHRASIHYKDGRVVELSDEIVGSGLNYETAHFCDLLRAGKLQSPILSHDVSRAMIRLLDHARAGLDLVYPFERGL